MASAEMREKLFKFLHRLSYELKYIKSLHYNSNNKLEMKLKAYFSFFINIQIICFNEEYLGFVYRCKIFLQIHDKKVQVV